MPVSQFDFTDSFEKIAESVNVGIFDLLHTGIALMSATGNFLYCNKAFLEMFNLPKDVIGQHITEYFLTGEQGVMSSIRTRKMVVCSSLTTTNAQGISFRYPLMDRSGKLRGVIVESIPTSIGKDKLLALLETVRNLEVASNYFEQREIKKVGMFHTFSSIVGESPAIEEMKQLGLRFACSKESILLYGESGTGKELVAQALHMASPRADKPFVTVNCAALPQELMESELFGYDAGAFTGAKAGGLPGKFEMANTGTIFLDEIGELPLAVQAKLLRVLESGENPKNRPSRASPFGFPPYRGDQQKPGRAGQERPVPRRSLSSPEHFRTDHSSAQGTAGRYTDSHTILHRVECRLQRQLRDLAAHSARSRPGT